jgi:hypothetical protein
MSSSFEVQFRKSMCSFKVKQFRKAVYCASDNMLTKSWKVVCFSKVPPYLTNSCLRTKRFLVNPKHFKYISMISYDLFDDLYGFWWRQVLVLSWSYSGPNSCCKVIKKEHNLGDRERICWNKKLFLSYLWNRLPKLIISTICIKGESRIFIKILEFFTASIISPLRFSLA